MARTAWSSRDDQWWARVAIVVAIVVTSFGVLAAADRGARLEVVIGGAVTVAGIAAKARWARLPTSLLVLVTFAPAVVLNLRERGEGTTFLLITALSFVVIVEPRRPVRLAAGTLAAIAPAAIQLATQQDWGWPFWMLGIGFSWLSSEQSRRFRQLVAELEATRERLAENAVHLERRRIAAELHDLVGHSLTVVLLHVTAARRRVGTDPAGSAEALIEAERVGRASLTEIRASAAALREPLGEGTAPIPSVVDVEGLIEQVRAAGTDVTVEVVGDLAEVGAVPGLAVYRVVQESLVNASRHAPDAVVTVRVRVGQQAVDVAVADRGGRHTDPGEPGVGLIGMRERVQALGGSLQAGPADGGWRVHAVVPLLAAAPTATGAVRAPSRDLVP